MPAKRLLIAYVLDWVLIVAIAAVGGAINWIQPYYRPFSVTDLSISFPYQPDELIKTSTLVVVGLVAPAAIIFLICLFIIPGPSALRRTPKSLLIRRKLWEWNVGWMGLALSLATAFMLTQGMKLLFGKHRPDLLSRCRPDLSPTSIRRHAVDSFAVDFSSEWVLVDVGICTQTDSGILKDGFKSFPSGHASFSWAGLLYLTLYLCSKFAITFPSLTAFSPSPRVAQYSQIIDPAGHSNSGIDRDQSVNEGETPTKSEVPGSGRNDEYLRPNEEGTHNRNQAAAAPIWTFVVALVPVAVAIYICSTRYAQYRHFGSDLIGGSVIGIVCALIAFRWFHCPLGGGAGWAWGARSRDRAFGIGVGTSGYVGTEGWASRRAGASRDIESGH